MEKAYLIFVSRIVNWVLDSGASEVRKVEIEWQIRV